MTLLDATLWKDVAVAVAVGVLIVGVLVPLAAVCWYVAAQVVRGRIEL